MAVCLHCLHEARMAARERRQQIIVRTAVWTLSIAVVGIVGAAGVNAAVRQPAPPPVSRHARRAPAKPAEPRPDSVLPVVASATPVMQQGVPAASTAAPVTDTAVRPTTVAGSASSTGAVVESTPTNSVSASAAITPIVPQGRTDLRDSTFAVRSGDTVVVHFDTSPLRTRRADKFETVVRQTLPAVLGARADTLLGAIPAGKLAAPNELVTVLPTKGIHLSAPNGTRLVLWPETRPGRDGPLVVAYRVSVEK